MSQRIWQVNMGVFVDSQTACFTNLNRIPSIVAAHPFERIEHFEPLFEAIRHLFIEGYEFIVMLIGQGKAESKLRQLTKSMGLACVIHFVSDNVQLRSIFLEADIFVEPVPNIMFNGAIPEAMSVGMVVAGPGGGVDGLLIENETAVLFDHKSPESIHSTLKMLMDRRDYAQYVAKKAQAYLKRNNTVTSMMDTLIDAYRSAVKTNAQLLSKP
jgi:glycosyltransferase involved in cell wall biosynthesis